MPGTRRVGVFSKPSAPAAQKLIQDLIRWLTDRNYEVRYDEITAGYAGLTDGLSREKVPDGCDVIIVLGGDGTLLSASRAIAGRPIPLFPVNLGGLGFLTSITVDEIFPELERALDGELRCSIRRLLRIDLMRGGKRISRYEALNDAVITKAALARIIDASVYVDDMFVCTYKADGLIISTPTGSTAYSLAAGGPIVFPSVEAFCITPICPHMLTNRPVLVPESSAIRLVSRARDEEAYLTIDGQVGEPLKRDDEVRCAASEHTLQLIRPPRMLFFDVLREKLSWGER